jgi:hypothetical protein
VFDTIFAPASVRHIYELEKLAQLTPQARFFELKVFGKKHL